MARKSVLKILYTTILSILFTFTFVSFNRFDIQAADPIPTVQWIGGTDTHWETAANWSTGLAPTLTDDVLINLAGTININGTTTVNSLVLGNDTTSTAVILNFAYDSVTSGALTIGGGDLKMYAGTQITHSAGTSAIVGRIYIEVTSGNFTINTGASINVDGKGYAGGNGYVEGDINGAGDSDSSSNRRAAAGGGHSGYGGNSSTGRVGGDSYGNPLDPVTLGSGGGNVSGTGGAGGGVVKISLTSGSFNLSGGTIYARGIGGSVVSYARVGGGGAGGSINISAESINITDSGIISSRGGNANNGTYISRVDSGVGSGGYIYLEYSTKNFFDGFDVDVGTGIPTTQTGQHGSGGIYVTRNKSNDYADMQLRNDNNLYYGIDAKRFTFSSPMQLNSLSVTKGALLDLLSTITLEEIYLTDNGILYLPPEAVVNAQDITWATGGLLVDRGGSFPLLGETDLTVPAGAMINIDVPKSYVNGYIYGTVSHSENKSSFDYKLDLTFSGDLNIYPGGSLNVDGKGYSSGNGYIDGEISGAGQTGGTSNANVAGGGGHGGGGGDSSTGRVGGDSYGDNENPLLPGSAGGASSGGLGGAGGGVILLNVAGIITLSESSISANGGNPSIEQYARIGGGGAGGSINISTSRLYGGLASSITTLGGFGRDGYYVNYVQSGGGGGGRISMTYSYSSFLGDISSAGGIATGTAVNGSDGTIFLYQTNQIPEVDPLDITPTQHGNIYPGNTVIVDTIYSDPDGQDNLNQLYFVVQNPAGQDIEFLINNSAVELLDQTPEILSGSSYISNVTYSIYPTFGTDQETKVIWEFDMGWNWTKSDNIKYGIRAIDVSLADTGYVLTTNTYSYKNTLEFNQLGTLLVTDELGNPISNESWMLPNAVVNWTGYKVVYEGETNIYPNPTDYNVRLEDGQARFWLDGGAEGIEFDLTTNTLGVTTIENIYTLSIVDIATGGSSTDTKTFTIKVDGDEPVITFLDSTTHPDDQVWYSENIFTATWEALDIHSGVEAVYRYITQDGTLTDEDIVMNGIIEPLSEWTSDELADGVWNFYLLVRDMVGNVISTMITFSIDASKPNIGEITGLYNNVWQNITKQPTLSWNNPLSISGNTYYITTDGTTPSSSNFRYATNQTTYTLPAQAEGETTIKVVARSGAGIYSDVSQYILKYDSTPTSAVSNMSASVDDTNRVTLNWVNPTESDFTKTVVVRKAGSLPATPTDGTKIYEGTLQTFTGTALESSTTYYYGFWSYDHLNNISQRSTVSITTRDLLPPSPVSNLNAVVNSSNDINLSWSNPSDVDFAKVILVRKVGSNPTSITDGTKIYEGNAFVYTDTNLNSKTKYHYTVWAYDTTGNVSASVSVNTTTRDLTPPGPVTNLNTTTLSNGVRVTWSNPSDSDFSKVILYRNNILIYEGNLTTYTDTLSTQGTYTYLIAAYDTSGNKSTEVNTSVEFEPVVETITITTETSTQPKSVEEGSKTKVVVGESLEIKIPVSQLMGNQDFEENDRFVIQINDKEYEMKLSQDRTYVTTTVSAPDIKGDHTMFVVTIRGEEVLNTLGIEIEVIDEEEDSAEQEDDLTIYIIVGIVILVLSSGVLYWLIASKKKSL